MAVQILPLFAPTVLTTSPATIYAAPATPATITVARLRVRLTNTSAGAVTCSVYAIPSGGTAVAGNACLYTESIANPGHLDIDVPVLGPGGFIQATASANTAITISQLDGIIFS